MKYSKIVCCFFVISGIAAFFSSPIAARPVSYHGAWTMMFRNNAERNAVHVHYSPNVWNSVGYYTEYRPKKKYQLHAFQWNALLERWNQPTSQANLYLKSGLGAARNENRDLDSKQIMGAGFLGLAVDWEDRRFYTSYGNRYNKAGELSEFFEQHIRFGIAPYIGDYGDWHTWLILGLSHFSDEPKEIRKEFLVRLFKKVHLLELGLDNDGKYILNWILRF